MQKETYNRSQYDADWEKRIREEWFPKHQAFFKNTPEGTPRMMLWANPESSNYSITYMIAKGTLFVCGDVGDAIYRWGQDLSWKWLAGLDTDYFCGKCCASEHGRQYYDWDSHVAAARVNEHIISTDMERRFNRLGGPDTIGHKDEWAHWLSVNGHEVFGSDYVEMGNLGKVIAWRCRAHLIGIKMAAATLNPPKP